MENRVCENQETTIMRAFEFRKEGLEYLQKLPLEEKITLSKNLIVSCMETFGEQVYISFSGGKDSTVLSSLVCSLKPDILHLFSDTGCEYPETLSFVEEERQRGKNIVPVRPVCRDGSVWTFERVVATYGYPLFSKAIANGIRTYRHAKTPVTKQHALDYLGRMYPKALSYLNYNISDLCCEKLKKAPLKRMAKRMQTQCSIIGTLAEESQVRKRDWIAYGSNIFFRRKTTSVGRCLSGQNETSGIILSFIKYLFPIYMDKDIKETDVCFAVSVCVRSDGNWELTALRDCR